MDYERFQVWLMAKKGYSNRASRNVLSRCRRIERLVGQSMKDIVRTQQSVDEVMSFLSSNADDYLRAGANKVTAVSILRTALRLAHDYKARR